MPSGNPDELSITTQDFTDFEHAVTAVQQAWSKGDVAALRRVVTPEMLSYFSEQLADNASQGIANIITDVKLEQGDLAESWREGDVEYATAALCFSAVDYDRSLDSGAVVRGSKDTRTTATESWTFMRHAGSGRWLLSAIQQ
jgi:predicted lipid-binding transport protein (Tim44 family)